MCIVHCSDLLSCQEFPPTMHTPCYACPPAMLAPLPCMPSCHTQSLPCMPPVLHAPCYTCPNPCHACPKPYHARPPATHGPTHALFPATHYVADGNETLLGHPVGAWTTPLTSGGRMYRGEPFDMDLRADWSQRPLPRYTTRISYDIVSAVNKQEDFYYQVQSLPLFSSVCVCVCVSVCLSVCLPVWSQ